MFSSPGSPLIIQGDQSILLDLHDPRAEDARKSIAAFAELEKDHPEHIHSYRLNPLSLWIRRPQPGYSPKSIMETLDSFSRYPIPASVERNITEIMGRFGMIKLLPSESLSRSSSGLFFLQVLDQHLFDVLNNQRSLKKLVIPR
jgi:DNA excision repair protein ERCC-3